MDGQKPVQILHLLSWFIWKRTPITRDTNKTELFAARVVQCRHWSRCHLALCHSGIIQHYYT